MLKYIGILLCGLFFSFYYFPFEFSFIPGINTKMMLAVGGLVLFAYNTVKDRCVIFDKQIFTIFILAATISLCGLFSIVFNNTPDTAYATYLVSMTVWLSAAYFICVLIHQVHGHVDFEIVTYYMIAVCLFQCIIALIIDSNPHFQQLVDTYINQDQAIMHKVKRLYGIGAALDVAGIRFSACLILMSLLIHYKHNLPSAVFSLIIAAFIAISVMGNMVARTTTVGVILGVSILLIPHVSDHKAIITRKIFFRFIGALLLVLSIIGILFILYKTNAGTQRMLRFAFEGFFNWVETGEWHTSSTETLQTMYVFPERLKTWIVGDGYFSNPNFSDENYIGDTVKYGYYMGTDVGYLRFIFYFGCIGLAVFMAFMTYCAKACAEKQPKYKMLFWLLLLENFIVWFKVSTDIFLVFALMICICEMMPEEGAEEFIEE